MKNVETPGKTGRVGRSVGGRGVYINGYIVTHRMICCFIEMYTDVIESY